MSIDFSPQQMIEQCKPNSKIWIALSGGLDSTVLLHALFSLKEKNNFSLSAVHIHHGLQNQADDWQSHCEKECNDRNVPLLIHKLNLSSVRDNIEEQARQLRYAFFASILEENAVLMTGHHQNDQAETVLLQLIRGAGPKGLSAMPEEMPLGLGKLIRPLLGYSRESLLAYAKAHSLKWIEDGSNDNTRFSRNFIRHDIFPLLKKRWPAVMETLSRTAAHCAESQNLLDEYASQLLAPCLEERGGLSFIHSRFLYPLPLRLSPLKTYTLAQKKLVLRYWLMKQGLVLPSQVKLDMLLHTFLNSAADKNPEIRWGGLILRRYRDQLYIVKSFPAHDLNQIYDWQDLSKPLFIPSLSMHILAKKIEGQGIRISPNQSWLIRFRSYDSSLKKQYQALAIPPFCRDYIPLLYINNELACIIGYKVIKKFQVNKEEVGINIEVKFEKETSF